MKPENLIQGTKEWLEFRQNKIGASDAACIMGVGFHSPYKLWQVKLGMTEIHQSPAMARGLDLEPMIRKEYELQTGINVEPEVIVHPEIHWMIASLDGHNAEKKVAVEIKTANKIDHESCKNGQVPEKYYPQLQHQMACLGYNSIDYFSWHETDTVLVKLNRNDDYIKVLYEMEEKFYQCMIDLTPPEMTEEDYFERSDEIWLEKSKEWVEACENFNIWKEKKDSLRDELIQASNGRSSIGGGVRLRQYFSKGSVNYNTIPELKDVDLNSYRSPQKKMWRLEVDGRYTKESYN